MSANTYFLKSVFFIVIGQMIADHDRDRRSWDFQNMIVSDRRSWFGKMIVSDRRSWKKVSCLTLETKVKSWKIFLNAGTCRWYMIKVIKFDDFSTTSFFVLINGGWRQYENWSLNFQFSIESISSLSKHLFMFRLQSMKSRIEK